MDASPPPPIAGPDLDPRSAGELLPLVYDALRRIAASKLAGERPGNTLQPTALVHEAWLRLGNSPRHQWANEEHFLATAAEAMRRILVERARRRLRIKRGGDPERVDFDDSAILAPAEDEKILEIHDALDALAAEAPEMARIVKLRFFAGLSHEEIAVLLNVNEKTVRRHWEAAKLRLHRMIRADP